MRPPIDAAGPLAWMRANLFGRWWSTALTLALGYLLLRFAWAFIGWAVVHAVWTVPHTAAGQPETAVCRPAAGACWAVVRETSRFLLFGLYPYDQQWRPATCVGLFILLYAVSAMRRFWCRELALVWIAILAAILGLMGGRIAGLPRVPNDQWGGLPITLILATFGLACAFPLAVATALGRRSHALPAVRWLCIAYVELIRGVPLISLLFMASAMFPLFLPPGVEVDLLADRRQRPALVPQRGVRVVDDLHAGMVPAERGGQAPQGGPQSRALGCQRRGRPRHRRHRGRREEKPGPGPACRLSHRG